MPPSMDPGSAMPDRAPPADLPVDHPPFNPFLFYYYKKEPVRTYGFIAFSRLWMGVYLPMIGCPLRVKGRERFAEVVGVEPSIAPEFKAAQERPPFVGTGDEQAEAVLPIASKPKQLDLF